ncbi:Ulp1 protease family protein [Ophiocordyceps camponoti-floridani]|uniref:Ulp1 protease family protein n=1 Tax=Ophiocordyceps camponoti-floridani TaxID=2030778 RepID=A0A8H4QCK2_9HYPO|nr:Ulp1 protease family protein [Ophiocordyceps camponoti-floridani]
MPATSVVRKSQRVKRFNALPEPLNTLNHRPSVSSDIITRPLKRPKLELGPSVSPHFQQHGHQDVQTLKGYSPQSIQKAAPTTESYARGSRFPQVRAPPNQQHRRQRTPKDGCHKSASPRSDTRESTGDNSDILSRDPPPANVVSDVPRRRRRVNHSPSTSRATNPSAKLCNLPGASEEVADSEDELGRDTPLEITGNSGKRTTNFSRFVDNRTKRRGDIPQTAFKQPLRPQEVLACPAKDIHIGIKVAVSGKTWYERKQDQQPGQVFLRQHPENTRELLPTFAHGEERPLPWLHIDVGRIQKLQHNFPSGPFIIIERPLAKLLLELESIDDAKKLLGIIASQISPDLIYKQDDVGRIVENFLEKVRNYSDCRRAWNGELEVLRPAKVAKTPWHIQSSTFALDRDPPTSTNKRIIDQLRQSTRTAKEDTVMGSEPEVCSTNNNALQMRRTRSSLPTAPVASPILDRWTSDNPKWEDGWEMSLMYPATGKNRTTVDVDDIPRLDEGEFLNDNLISFYLRYLEVKLETERPELRQKVYICSTFFFEKLRSTRGKINYDGVKTWTAKFDLFSYDYIIVPVNEHAHWYLAIICNVANALNGIPFPASNGVEVIDVSEDRQEPVDSPHTSKTAAEILPDASSGTTQQLTIKHPRIVTLDSLGHPHSPTTKALKEYLVEEARDKKNADLAILPNGMKAKDVPTQNNFCDCGLFVLGYVEEFLKDPYGNARKLLTKEPLGWAIQPSALRNRIRELLFDLQAKQRSRLMEENRARKQRSSPSQKAKEGKKQAAPAPVPAPAAAPASVSSTPTSDTKAGSHGVKVDPATSTKRNENPSFVISDSPAVDDVRYVKTLSDSSCSIISRNGVNSSTSTPPGGRLSKSTSPVEESRSAGKPKSPTTSKERLRACRVVRDGPRHVVEADSDKMRPSGRGRGEKAGPTKIQNEVTVPLQPLGTTLKPVYDGIDRS